MEKLNQLYNEYDFNFTDESIAEAVKEIIAKNFDKYNNVEVWKQCFNQIDLTSLNSTDTEDKIGGMMERVNEFKEKYPDEPDEFIHPVHGKQVDTWDGDAYHHPCPIYEDGYIDYSWGYMGD